MPAIEITIKKSETGQGQSPTMPKANQEPGKTSVKDSAINTALIMASRQVMTNGINQIAELTGNYAAADRINDTLGIGADILLVSTGPVGVIAVTTKYATNIANSFIKQYRDRNNIELMRQRVGMISTQGSRYGK